MLADMAVAVHPADARYTALIGKTVRLPITGRENPIVAAEPADPGLGSGAVKIPPGRDFPAFSVGQGPGFKAAAMLNMLNATGKGIGRASRREKFLASDVVLPRDHNTK